MRNAGIYRVKTFKQELSNLRRKHIICCTDGKYYRPSNTEEYTRFIKKCEEQRDEIIDLIELALKESKNI